MTIACEPLPDWTEFERLAVLKRYRILDTPPEPAFDDVVRTLSEFLEAPMALVSLVDADRQWFKAEIGLGQHETPRSSSICATAMLQSDTLIVPDTADDPRFFDNPLVIGEPRLRFYAGEPLKSREGFPLGSLCVLDTAPRPRGLTPPQRSLLKTLARQVSSQLELRRAIIERDAALVAQRRTEAALEQRAEISARDRDMVWRTSQDLLALCGVDGVVREVNPAWMELLGHAPAELIGSGLEWLIHPDDQEAMRLGLLRLADGAIVRDFDSRIRAADGTYRSYGWHCIPEGDRFYAAGRDITQRKQLEEQLRQSQKMEAVGQLTGGLAHDFNNLLAGIIGSLELLQIRAKQGRIADLERYITVASGAAERAAALTHRLLAFSRRQTLVAKPTDINHLMEGMADLIRRTIGSGITLEILPATELWSTFIDGHQLENALLNLCINARDAMPNGGRITVETANRHFDAHAALVHDVPPGEYVSLCVGDTGSGMAPDVAARAFDPFYTTKPMGLGTGLGLSMIYGFVRQSGGQARIYSELGIGTMVSLFLPRGAAVVASPEPAVEASSAPQIRRGETVLVVDDEPTVRMLVTEVLDDLGCVAIEAADGESGLKVLRTADRVDLLVTDVGLPGGMNGRQLADAARVSRPGLKVLFITGYAETVSLGESDLAPGMHVLTKPFALERLAGTIQALIAKA